MAHLRDIMSMFCLGQFMVSESMVESVRPAIASHVLSADLVSMMETTCGLHLGFAAAAAVHQ